MDNYTLCAAVKFEGIYIQVINVHNLITTLLVLIIDNRIIKLYKTLLFNANTNLTKVHTSSQHLLTKITNINVE